MSRGRKSVAMAGGLTLVALAAWLIIPSRAQTPELVAPSRPGRFAFHVVESFDAKYLGDSPGHTGRGKIAGEHLDAALGDPVYREDRRIGKVTGLNWDRSKDVLTVEFDSEPFELDTQGQPVGQNRV